MTKKALIIAGTHQREIGFSHSVADMIIERHGVSRSNPDRTFVGLDNAREAHMWDFGNIVLAKIIRRGEPSQEYLSNLPVERLLSLAVFKLQNYGNGAEYVERFDRDYQWTSVHDPLIEAVQPSFLFDLHSYHKYAEGLDGTAGYISASGNTTTDEVVKRALSDAKRISPEVYGIDVDTDNTPRDSSLEIPFTSQELLRILLTLDEAAIKDFAQKLKLYEGQKFRDSLVTWKSRWDFQEARNRNSNELSNYCFEAVHWSQRQQIATADFIVNYLAPQV